MSNIGIHGYELNEAKKLRRKVFTLFGSQELVKKMVVEVYHTSVEDENKESQPFFRVYYTEDEPIEVIIGMLISTFGLDVEYFPVKFKPGKG